MEELKTIISSFTRKDVKDIHEGTLINNTAIPGSIMIHRMYATINKAGYSIKNYVGINSYGELLSRLNGSSPAAIAHEIKRPVVAGEKGESNASNAVAAIGIDIEHIDNLPKVPDFREDDFYRSNFSNKEISYAMLKPKTYETLTGLFCAKEALCKAENDIKSIPFNQIEIEHSVEGAPVFRNFSLSISHANGFAIAVAVKNPPAQKPEMVHRSTFSEIKPIEAAPFAASQNTGKTNYLLLALIIFITISSILLFVILKRGFYPNLPHHLGSRSRLPFAGREKIPLCSILISLQFLLV